jgi:hypothetical protein
MSNEYIKLDLQKGTVVYIRPENIFSVVITKNGSENYAIIRPTDGDDENAHRISGEQVEKLASLLEQKSIKFE